MAAFELKRPNGKVIRVINGDSFSRACQAEIAAGRSLANADLTTLGKWGDPSKLKFGSGTFTNAKFDGANLYGADVRGATMTGTSMKMVDMRMMMQFADTWSGVTLTQCMQDQSALYGGYTGSGGTGGH